jgi:hypothetical protein
MVQLGTCSKRSLEHSSEIEAIQKTYSKPDIQVDSNIRRMRSTRCSGVDQRLQVIE